MRWVDEFKAFIQRGNVIDMAVGVIMGTAFGKIVSSLVGDVIMPVVGILTRGVNVAGLSYTFQDAQLKYGAFLQAIIDFLIIAICVFLIVKAINALHVQKVLAGPEKPAELTLQEKLLTEIRDLLKAQQPPSPGVTPSEPERPV
ncbi:MAG TPA: large-conductance mechanosensitive channel protein MscL [Gemmataceae bacterium]|nr:large-conductance mechanosensitive channel protein MscL [Gemmataceae bacterium]